MRRTSTSVVLALALAALSAGPSPAGEGDKYQEYKSRYKKRGNVHGLVFDHPSSVVHDGVIRAFANAELTVNVDHPTLGFVEGGRSRGVAGEVVRVWIDPEAEGKHRVEVRNIRVSRMGLLGLATTKDWSGKLLDELAAVLSEAPTLARLQAEVDAAPGSIEARRRLVEAYLAAGRSDDAVQAYRQLLDTHPRSHLDRARLAELLDSRGAVDEAISELAPLGDTDVDAALALARIQLQAGRASAAVQTLSPLVESHPSDLRARYHLARAALFAGDTAAASAAFATVIEQGGDHPLAAHAKEWQRTVPSGVVTPPDDAGAPLSQAVGTQLGREGLTALARPYLERAAGELPVGSERTRAQAALAAAYLDRKEHAALVAWLAPMTDQLRKEKRGELLHALTLGYCGQRDFTQALATAKLAVKAGHKDAKPLKEVLEGYV